MATWLTAAMLACGDGPTETTGGFLVILTSAEAPEGIATGASWRVDVRELSGFLYPDTTFRVTPADTAILDVPLATYIVSLSELPAACSTRQPLTRDAFVPEPGTTVTLRYNVDCSAFLVVRVATAGQAVDSAFVYRVDYPDGTSRSGVFAPTDTVLPDDIVPGDYRISLAHVAENCVITSDGGRRKDVTVAPPRATVVQFGVICSDMTYAPRILSLSSSMLGDSLHVFTLEATDPGSPGALTLPDIDQYVWDITDCRQRSLLRAGGELRQGLSQSGAATRGLDTVRLSVVMRPQFQADAGPLRCAALRVIDGDGNTTPVVEQRIVPPTGRAPEVRRFDAARLGPAGAARLEFTLDASDPDGDLAGTYMQLVLLDGRVVGRGISGHPGSQVPTLSFQFLPFPVESVAEVRLFVVDRSGNVTVVSDDDFFD